MKPRRILFVSESQDASPTRYRALAYFDLLKKNNWQPRHLAVTGLVRRLLLLHAARDADVLVILRKTFTPTLCRILRRAHQKLIFDLDDALFVKEDGSAPPRRAQRFANMARSVDLVWAGNACLAERAAPFRSSTIILPTSIDPARYPPAPPPGSVIDSKHFDAVWIGSSPTRKYLEALLPTLAQARKLIPTLRLKIIADFDLPQAHALGLPTLAIPWSAATEVAQLQSAHVGLAPLPDDPWTRGKCGLKILQYMAASLPVVASPVSVQSTIVLHNQTGLLASTPTEWLTALQHLAANPALRAAMGAAGRQRALADYALPATFSKMLASLNALVPPT